MSDIIEVHDQFYILATAALEPDRTRVLKRNDAFLIVDRQGDVRTLGLGSHGLFHDGTRHLSRMEMQIEGVRLMLLSSTMRSDNSQFVANLTNPDVSHAGHDFERDSVHLLRTLLLWDRTLHQEVQVQSYHSEPVSLQLAFEFGADFADIFEIRGTRRAARGVQRPPVVTPEGDLLLAYVGLDGVHRRTRISFDPPPVILDGTHAVHRLDLEPLKPSTVHVAIACEVGELNNGAPPRRRFAEAARATREALEHHASRGCTVQTSNEEFNLWVARSSADLAMMTTETPSGLFPYAGVPWFCCPFGRDGIVTALETLWVDPELARGVLSFLADTQATERVPERDAEPGKILHEARGGEIANLGEIPFGRYYGSADATPLFVMLASAYWRRTADTATIERLWPNVVRALAWIDEWGDADGDGFVEYSAKTPSGLRQQGWKDSNDSVSHADGSLAQGPIALCEIQAYTYAAKLGASMLAEVLGYAAEARRLREEAETLRDRFEAAYWCEDLSTYALALDGDKRPCRVVSSNAGHCLFAGIADPARAERVAATLLNEASFSGWGIRTLAAAERRYNPMSYHNGSVWPHDNALIAAGLAAYQRRHEAVRVLTGLFEASRCFTLHRLPELFCGFPRRAGEGPTLYPVACEPQTWAAGAVFLVLASLPRDHDRRPGQARRLPPAHPPRRAAHGAGPEPARRGRVARHHVPPARRGRGRERRPQGGRRRGGERQVDGTAAGPQRRGCCFAAFAARSARRSSSPSGPSSARAASRACARLFPPRAFSRTPSA